MRIVLPVVKFSTKTVELGRQKKSSESQTAKKLKPKLYATLAVLLLFSLAGLYVWRTLSSPNIGKVAITNSYPSPTARLPEYTTLTTNYYSLNYSESYTQQPAQLAPAGILDYKKLSKDLGAGAGFSNIEITIKTAPDGGITLDSTYDYYLKKQDRFKFSNKYYHGEAIVIVKNIKGPPETAGLWLHGSFLMIIKITTPDKQQAIDTELKDILSSVQWRQ
mgnify:CR=1 FL=1